MSDTAQRDVLPVRVLALDACFTVQVEQVAPAHAQLLALGGGSRQQPARDTALTETQCSSSE